MTQLRLCLGPTFWLFCTKHRGLLFLHQIWVIWLFFHARLPFHYYHFFAAAAESPVGGSLMRNFPDYHLPASNMLRVCKTSQQLETEILIVPAWSHSSLAPQQFITIFWKTLLRGFYYESDLHDYFQLRARLCPSPAAGQEFRLLLQKSDS